MACDYWSMLGLKLTHVSKRGYWYQVSNHSWSKLIMNFTGVLYTRRIVHKIHPVWCFPVIFHEWILRLSAIDISLSYINRDCPGANVKYKKCELVMTWIQNNYSMMTSSNGNISRVTGLLCGEFIGHRWIPHTRASNEGLWRFLWSAPE